MKKNKILLACSVTLVALSFFVIGLLISSSLDITSIINALGEEETANQGEKALRETHGDLPPSIESDRQGVGCDD